MFAVFAGLTAIGVSFCESWSRLTSTTGETAIGGGAAAAVVASAAPTASAATTSRVRCLIGFLSLGVVRIRRRAYSSEAA